MNLRFAAAVLATESQVTRSDRPSDPSFFWQRTDLFGLRRARRGGARSRLPRPAREVGEVKASDSVVVASGDLSRYGGPFARHDVDRVVLAGDWHGIAWWGRKVITTASAHGILVILHAGDFGIWAGEGATYRD